VLGQDVRSLAQCDDLLVLSTLALCEFGFELPDPLP
jgi:hypothetical protein